MADKESVAIARLREAANTSERYYEQPLLVTTSGGKDSSIYIELAIRSGIDFEVMHNHTTADAPETVRLSVRNSNGWKIWGSSASSIIRHIKAGGQACGL